MINWKPCFERGWEGTSPLGCPDWFSPESIISKWLIYQFCLAMIIEKEKKNPAQNHHCPRWQVPTTPGCQSSECHQAIKLALSWSSMLKWCSVKTEGEELLRCGAGWGGRGTVFSWPLWRLCRVSGRFPQWNWEEGWGCSNAGLVAHLETMGQPSLLYR